MEAKEDVARWAAGELPLDVWALDMNWRNTSAGQDRYYLVRVRVRVTYRG